MMSLFGPEHGRIPQANYDGSGKLHVWRTKCFDFLEKCAHWAFPTFILSRHNVWAWSLNPLAWSTTARVRVDRLDLVRATKMRLWKSKCNLSPYLCILRFALRYINWIECPIFLFISCYIFCCPGLWLYLVSHVYILIPSWFHLIESNELGHRFTNQDWHGDSYDSGHQLTVLYA